MKAKSILLGMIAGGITSGIAVLLSAPSSGKDTTRNLQQFVNNWKIQLEDVKDAIVEMKNSIKTATTESKENINFFVQEIKSLIADWQKEIEPHQEKLMSEIESIQLSLEELEAEVNDKKKV
ncbi:YtxH domain-containing protein [Bacillus dakarensis]|uniref:YtxH domain-containing protein n=1 Tax=Robertmurraya dakarensis TaxID=1926278 RepID=UPI00098222CE|nr:YtxH domain-containing protein [Bacillus dakarensis]